MHRSVRVTAVSAFLLLFHSAGAQPLQILMIGDSLTEEYRFEGIFSGPEVAGVPNPVANTRNWVEIVADRRSSTVSFGSFDPNFFKYSDFRNGGYANNYGVPAFTTGNWMDVIDGSGPGGNAAYLLGCIRTHDSLTNNLGKPALGAVVIFLGGNDLKSDYGGIFHDADPPALLQDTVANLRKIAEFVRDENPTIPLVICTFPDIGATPEVAGKYTDPRNLARARQRIADANAAVIALAGTLGAQVARVDTLTDRIFDEHPFHLNGTVFQYPPDPANPPGHLFCRDGFHPSTVGQALIGNLILDAVNRATGRSIPLMTNREILGDVLGLNPDQPYLTWAGGAGGMTDNPDGDSSPNLIEYLLGTLPGTADTPFSFSASGGLSFRPLAERTRFADLGVMESGTLNNDWAPVPAQRITVAPDGTWQVAPNGSGRNFYRLSATPKP